MPDIDQEAIRLYIRRRRDALKVRQQALAEALECSRSAVANRDAGLTEWTQDDLNAIAELLGFEGGWDLLAAAMREADQGIPLLGDVPAGQVVRHWQQIADPDAPRDHIPRPNHIQGRGVYALRVVGDSMEPKIPAGAIIICRHIPIDAEDAGLSPETPIVATFSEDADTPGVSLGYLVLKGGGRAVLRKENAARYDPIPIDLNADPPELIGISPVIEIMNYNADADSAARAAQERGRKITEGTLARRARKPRSPQPKPAQIDAPAGDEYHTIRVGDQEIRVKRGTEPPEQVLKWIEHVKRRLHEEAAGMGFDPEAFVDRIVDPELSPPPGEKASDKSPPTPQTPRARKKPPQPRPRDGTNN